MTVDDDQGCIVNRSYPLIVRCIRRSSQWCKAHDHRIKNRMIHRLLFACVAVCIHLGQYSSEATLFQCNRTAACGCSLNNANINARIVGGEIAASHSWGWSVSLNRATSRGICGGAILSGSYVLTAAHCVNSDALKPSLFSVVVGKDSLNTTGGQQINVSRIFVHPNYNTRTLENDIALLYLSTPINLRDDNVAKICLPAVSRSQRTYYPVDKKPVVAIGWGTTSSGGSASSSLRQVTVNVVNNKDTTCKSIMKNSDLQFCAAVRGGGKGRLLLCLCEKDYSTCCFACRHVSG